MLGALPISRKSLTLEELALDSTPKTIASARELLLEYGRFVQAQPGVASFCFGALEREVERLPQSYLEQGGGAILAQLNGLPAGFVAWRSIPGLDSAWELKRLWTRPEARGSGLGRRLAEAVEQGARAAGKSRLVLDTAPDVMAAAHRLYLDLGFQPCPPYNGPALKGIIYLSKQL
jgi:putative acetyltransferase